MSIESTVDLEGLREAGRVTRETLDALVTHVDVGATTGDLDAVAAAVLGAQRRALGAGDGLWFPRNGVDQRERRDRPRHPGPTPAAARRSGQSRCDHRERRLRRRCGAKRDCWRGFGGGSRVDRRGRIGVTFGIAGSSRGRARQRDWPGRSTAKSGGAALRWCAGSAATVWAGPFTKRQRSRTSTTDRSEMC